MWKYHFDILLFGPHLLFQYFHFHIPPQLTDIDRINIMKSNNMNRRRFNHYPYIRSMDRACVRCVRCVRTYFKSMLILMEMMMFDTRPNHRKCFMRALHRSVNMWICEYERGAKPHVTCAHRIHVTHKIIHQDWDWWRQRLYAAGIGTLTHSEFTGKRINDSMAVSERSEGVATRELGWLHDNVICAHTHEI